METTRNSKRKRPFLNNFKKIRRSLLIKYACCVILYEFILTTLQIEKIKSCDDVTFKEKKTYKTTSWSRKKEEFRFLCLTNKNTIYFTLNICLLSSLFLKKKNIYIHMIIIPGQSLSLRYSVAFIISQSSSGLRHHNSRWRHQYCSEKLVFFSVIFRPFFTIFHP